MTVIVAGSGAAGLVAALAAATAGADVLVLERSDLLGGTTALGGGRVWIPANHCQEEGADSVEAARAYLAGLFPAKYAHLTEAFLASAAEMARFVESNTRHRFAACPDYPDYHPDRPGATAGGRCLDMLPADLSAMVPLARQVRVPPGYLPMTHAEWERWRYPSRFDRDLLGTWLAAGIRTNGVALAASLVDGVIRAGARIERGARLIDVLTRPADARTEAGVSVTHAVIERTVEGYATERLPASAVILACGGFDWDEGFRAAWHPAAQRATGASPGNAGDALRIAGRLGAATDNLGEGWWMPMVAVPGEEVDGVPYPRSLIRERALPRQIMVNAAGRRFADEAAPYNEVGKAMHAADASGCPNDPAYLVFDAGFARKYALPGFSGARVPGWMPRAGSLAGLAAMIGVDPAGLTATVARWNDACAGGADPDFGRGGNVYDRYGGDPDVAGAPNLGPLTEPPFYAVRVLAGTIGTKGGPVTDAAGTVLTPAGAPIPGLYAVGNAAAFWTGDAYPAPGATLGIAMTMAYIAGRHAASQPRSPA
jgi:succinate dehydrogenase/fumarate reductase flavoprotein subunit